MAEKRKATDWMQRYMSLPTVAVLAEVAVVQDSVTYYRELNSRLESDPETMERVVREQYNMKRDNEDVFITE